MSTHAPAIYRVLVRQVSSTAHKWVQTTEHFRAQQHATVSPRPLHQPQLRALLLDAAGTLLCPSEPAARVYLRYAAEYGCKLTEHQILANFRRVFNEPWTKSTLRYAGDGRPFWKHIVEQATGCDDEQMHENVYRYFASGEAWDVAPGAFVALKKIREAGYRLAVVSNFDTRLRPILDELELSQLFDNITVSSEVGFEKPNPEIFMCACEQLQVSPAEAIVVGDDRRNDISGARDAGCYAWLWGVDVFSMKEVASRLQSGITFQ